MQNNTYLTLGATNHTNKEREINDYYATDPKAIIELCKIEKFNNNIWECACGEGHLSNALKSCGYNVFSSDIINYGYNNKIIDFLHWNKPIHNYDIITNPPYKNATEFCYKALDLVDNGYRVAMFLKVQFLEGKERRKLFDKYPPKYIYVTSSRITCAKNGDFETMNKNGGGALAYAWFIWEKGYQGETILKWFN